MKIFLSKKSITKIALLMLLSLNVIAGMTILVSAAPVKDPTVYIDGSGFVTLTWKSSKSETYISDAYANFGGLETVSITPSHGWHIEVVLIDGDLVVDFDEDGFSLIDVEAKRMISITFLENGGVDDVETGSEVESYPDPEVGLVFNDVLSSGYAYAYTIGIRHYLQVGESWDIQTTADFNPDITIYLVVNLTDLPDGFDPYNLTLWRTEVELGDVNFDGIVDGTDQSIIANANPDASANPHLDLNNDGIIDNEDVELSAHNHGMESVWEPLESWVRLVDDLAYVYGVTDHLSIFGVHRR